MRKLTQDEYDILIRIAAFGRDGCITITDRDAYADVMEVLHGLVRKKRLTASEGDGAFRYELTAQGWKDAA